ncbi:MAG: hypothetical protein SOT76_11070, partial [Eubacteriales bacterium]|nr:hypothetical protein [Eubacteriales bacterium]
LEAEDIRAIPRRLVGKVNEEPVAVDAIGELILRRPFLRFPPIAFLPRSLKGRRREVIPVAAPRFSCAFI